MAAEVSQQDLRVAPENPGKRSRSGSCGAPRRRSVPVSAAHNRVVTHAFFAFVPAAGRPNPCHATGRPTPYPLGR